MTQEEFNEMISDFDGFMRKKGYYTVKEIADYEQIEKISVRQRMKRGALPGSVKIGNKCYIPLDTIKM